MLLSPVLCVGLCLSSWLGCFVQAKSWKTLLVSFDGFRSDYFKKTTLPNFNKLARMGVKADNVKSTFNTKSFPTHYSIATGSYQENHGIMGNHFHHPTYGNFSRLDKAQVQDPKWWLREPIWKTVRRQGKKAATYFWPGSETALREGYTREYVKEYNENDSFRKRLDQVVTWLKNDVVFATLYYHEPDKTGHSYGPESSELIAKLKEVDGYLGDLLDSLDTNGLSSTVNLIVVSDHGMDTLNQANIIDLEQWTEYKTIASNVEFTIDWGTSIQIQPIKGKQDAVYQALADKHDHLTVYKKQDIPDRFHYKNTDRVRDIIILAHQGYSVRFNNLQTLTDKGVHGYDNELATMKTMFRAKGPAFREDYTVTKPFSIVDIYSLLCNITTVKEAINDGNFRNVKGMLKSSTIQPTGFPSNAQKITTRAREISAASIKDVSFVIVPICMAYSLLF